MRRVICGAGMALRLASRGKILCLLAVLFIAVLASCDVFGNLWCVLTGRGFVIPAESSVFTFKVSAMSEGSGEWWLEAEEANFYYHYPSEEPHLYTKTAKHRN